MLRGLIYISTEVTTFRSSVRALIILANLIISRRGCGDGVCQRGLAAILVSQHRLCGNKLERGQLSLISCVDIAGMRAAHLGLRRVPRALVP